MTVMMLFIGAPKAEGLPCCCGICGRLNNIVSIRNIAARQPEVYFAKEILEICES